MADVYIVAGDGSCGKSSTIRALTGARVRGKINIAFSTPQGILDAWVEIRSLQESPNDLSPENFNQVLKNSGCQLAIIALRANQYNGQPDVQNYIDALQNAGHRIAGFGQLGSHWPQPTTNPQIQVVPVPVQSANSAPNQRAALLRTAWHIS